MTNWYLKNDGTPKVTRNNRVHPIPSHFSHYLYTNSQKHDSPHHSVAVDKVEVRCLYIEVNYFLCSYFGVPWQLVLTILSRQGQANMSNFTLYIFIYYLWLLNLVHSNTIRQRILIKRCDCTLSIICIGIDYLKNIYYENNYLN